MKRILGKSPAQAKRLAVQRGLTPGDWPKFLDPDCPHAKRLDALAVPDEITQEDRKWLEEVLKERHPGCEIEKC